MTGAHVFWLQCELHSGRLEHFPEHQPQFMKAGAIRHVEQVIKWAHPGPAEGTLNICTTERTKRNGRASKHSVSHIRCHALDIMLGKYSSDFSLRWWQTMETGT